MSGSVNDYISFVKMQHETSPVLGVFEQNSQYYCLFRKENAAQTQYNTKTRKSFSLILHEMV